MSREEHVLVTGAAGAIGAAFARAYARRSGEARFSLVDIDLAGAERTAATLSGRATAVRWDLAEPDALEASLAETVRARGPVDVLVNCAGVMDFRSIAATDMASGTRLLRIDLESPLKLMALVSPSMRDRRRGTIVNVSSMAGVVPLPGCAFYGAAKAGLAMASEVARAELAPFGVRVVTVLPGPVHSELERRARAQLPETMLTRLMPTGDAEVLAARMVEACEKNEARVVYPPIYALADRFAAIASAATRWFGPTPTDA